METGSASKVSQQGFGTPLPPVTYRLNWPIVILLVLGNLGFVAIGIYLTFFKEAANAKDWGIGLICVVFFGLILLTTVRDFFIRGPILIVDTEGVWDKRMSSLPIPWREVRKASIGKVKLNKFICLDLDDPEPYLPSPLSFRGIFARLNPIMRFSQMTITTLPLTGSAEEILATIERYRAQASESASSRL